MRKLLGATAGLLLLSGARALQGQSGPSSPGPTQVDTVHGSISAMLPSGVTLIGAGATVYVWADAPELRSALNAACDAGRANPVAWMAARTELDTPSGLPLDSTAARDLELLKRIAAIPHATGRADSAGRFTFVDVPFGTYWVGAELVQGSGIVQWWQRLELDAGGLALAKILRVKSVAPAVTLATQHLTHDQFCTGGEPARGAAEFELGQRDRTPSPPPESAYGDVEETAAPLDAVTPVYPDSLRKTGVEGTVTARFVIDTTGYVDMRTLRIIRSSDERFSEAVRSMLRRKRYRPARINGHDVRWRTSQDFVFSINP